MIPCVAAPLRSCSVDSSARPCSGLRSGSFRAGSGWKRAAQAACVICCLMMSRTHAVAAVVDGSVEPRIAQSDVATPIAVPGLTESRREGFEVAGGVFVDTGADACGAATLVNVAIGPPGSPETTTILGDNTPATGPDCTFTGASPVWFEALELSACANLRVEFCGTTPVQDPSYAFFFATCPTTGLNCNPRLNRDTQGRGAPYCAENNIWFTIDNVPAGVWYLPVYSDLAQLINGRGPYEITITAEECPGACCDTIGGTCVDGAAAAECLGEGMVFNAGQTCCELDCIAPGDEYGRFGVEMLSHIPIAGFPSHSTSANDAWGYVSPSGREYALIGLSDGTGFVDITDPFNPVIVADIPDTDSFWSDFKCVGAFCYNGNESGGGMQIIDVSDIDNGNVVLRGAFNGSGLSTIHTITANPDTNYVYINGSNVSGGRLMAVNVSNPTSPSIAGVWTGPGSTYVHDSLVVSYTSGPYAGREIAFCFCLGQGIRIVDVTNKANMFQIGQLFYPNMNLTHQGWLTGDRRYLIFNDEGDETTFGLTSTMRVANVENLAAPFLAAVYTNGLCSIDHDLIVDGDLVYQASYSTGLRVTDISNPLSPEEVAWFDTFPSGNIRSFVGAWGVHATFPSGVAVIADIQRGLFVLNYDCNRNMIDDTDDIASLTSLDCNSNGMPDECEAVNRDCDGNNRPDDCDIDDGAPDVNANNVPDSCECAEIVAALEVDGGAIPRNRYLSIEPNNGSASAAIRVILTNLDRFGSFNGQTRWVGPPTPQPDVGGGQYAAAPLQCTPHFADWSAYPVVNVYGAEVVPGSTYTVQMIGQICGGIDDESEFTTALVVDTGPWGDVAAPFGGGPTSFVDISAIVGSFSGVLSAIKKPRAQLQPNVPNPANAISFADISAAVAAFTGLPYLLAGPSACP